MAGAALFTAAWLAAGLWQGPGYRWTRDDISEMGAVTAPHAWLFLVPQAVAGLLTIGFALFALRPVLRPAGTVGIVAAWSAAGSAVQDLSDAAFRLDCRAADGCTAAQTTASGHGQWHAAFGLVCLLLLIGALFLTARAYRRLPAWAGWAAPTRWTGLLVVLGLLGVALPVTGPVHGLLQRGVALVSAVWGAAVAWRVHVLSRRNERPA
ncbi:DUF998 domain-containing protein [Actinoplanes nipponensis]|uniref:DUF998 domain-containing protein n=1 Tax=Actinoplanes nipponensis TaxID=135950 RepID=UPI0035E78D11